MNGRLLLAQHLVAYGDGVGRDELNFLLGGFAITVVPFVGFLLWTLVPMSDRRMVEWFAPFGQLLPSGIPLVRERLVRVRWSRRIGATSGALVTWAISSWYGLRYQESTPDPVGWLPLVGYVLGAVLAEVRALHRQRGDRRRAELRVRRVRDYVAPWFLALGALLTLCGVAAALAEAMLTTEYRVETTSISTALLRAAGVGAVCAVALWCSRAVVQLPVQRHPGVDPYLDDAFRQLSIVTCLASSMLLSLSMVSTWIPALIAGRGWFAAPLVVVVIVTMLVLWGAIRHPFAATFGPRLREVQTHSAGGDPSPSRSAATAGVDPAHAGSGTAGHSA